MADEIYLRYYGRLLVKRWPLVRDLAILALLVSLVFGVVLPSLNPPTFTAKANVGLVSTKSQVDFGTNIRTVVDSTTSLQAGVGPARMTSLVRLAMHPSIPTAVQKAIGSSVPIDALTSAIGVRPIPGTDMLEISVKAYDPLLAVKIANAWADEYNRVVNRIYAQKSPDLSTLELLLPPAKVRYDQAQSELVEFIRNSQIDSLQQRVRLLSVAVSYLTATPTQDTLAIPPEFTVVPPELRAIRELATLYQTKMKLNGVYADALSLQTQLAGGGDPEAVSSELAVLLLKTQAFSTGSSPWGGSANIQLDLSRSSTHLLSDVASLIKAIQIRLNDLDIQIQANSKALLPASSTQAGRTEDLIALVVQNLNASMNSIRAQLVAENARQKGITANHDLTWNMYTALAQKIEEQRTALALSDRTLDLMLPAAEATPDSVPPLLQMSSLVVISAIGAMVFGLVVSFILEALVPDVATPSIPWLLRLISGTRRRGQPTTKDEAVPVFGKKQDESI